MAIDPTMLTMMLMQTAPALLQALKRPDTTGQLSELVGERGYDPGLIQDSIPKFGGTPEQAVQGVFDTTTPQPFQSDGTSNLELLNLAENMSKSSQVQPANALLSAASMLAEGLPTDMQIPNPATHKSELDKLYDSLDRMPAGHAKQQYSNQLSRLANQKFGIKEFKDQIFKDKF